MTHDQVFSSIQELLSLECNPYFNVSIRDGHHSSTNEISYYANKLPAPDFSFDISNNKMLCNVDEYGTLKALTVYRDCFESDDIPGAWVAKTFTQQTDFFFSLIVGDRSYALNRHAECVTADLLLNIVPRARHDFADFSATVVTLPLIDAGGRRMDTVLYGLQVVNHGDHLMEGSVVLPKVYTDRHYDVRHISQRLLGDRSPETDQYRHVPFSLLPGESLWVPYCFYIPGCFAETETIEAEGTLAWVNRTVAHLKSLFGTLTMPDHPMAAYLLERCLHQSLGAIAMNQRNEVVGANWGTFPASERIWNKDMFYSVMALRYSDDPVFDAAVEWFMRYAVRSRGTKYPGGVFHSLSNSLSPIVLLGLYFQNHARIPLLEVHPEYYDRMREILDEVLAAEDGSGLFGSRWLSDAISLGKYHTGSNLCLWFACRTMARIADELYADATLGKRYADAAHRIGEAIETHLPVPGPFGRQYTEGISGLDGDKTVQDLADYDTLFSSEGLGFLTDILHGTRADLLMHDGEESDTTLMPVYGFCDYRHEPFRNYASFTSSAHNPTYGVRSRGIQWGLQSDATFPGYTTGLVRALDEESFTGPHGALTELERLADLDGSWWWWPYPKGAATGEVVRMTKCGKCGWAAGVFTNLFVDQFLGLRYEARERRLTIDPLEFVPGFRWERARLGDLCLTVDCGPGSVTVRNHGPFAITVVWTDADGAEVRGDVGPGEELVRARVTSGA